MTTEATAPAEGQENSAEQSAADPHIAKAQAAGWRPLEEFEGDPEAWVDAKEFIKRAPLYEKNHKLKREVSELRTTLHEMKGHITKVSEAAYRKAVADLQAQRDEAIDNGDRAQVHEIDKAIKDAESIKVAVKDEPHPAIADWEAKNGTWFYADPEVTDFGMARAQAYLGRHPNDFAGAMEAMEKDIKRAFPEKFTTAPKRKDPPPVEGGGKPAQSRSYGESDLTEEQRNVMKRFVRQGVMSKDEYIKELADSGLIGGKK